MFPFFPNKRFPFFEESQSSSGNQPTGPNMNQNQNQSFPFQQRSQNQQSFNPFDYDNHEFEEENPFSHHFMYPLPPKPKEQKQASKENTSDNANKKETTPPISKQLEAMVLDEDGLVDIDKVEKGYKKFMEYAVKVSPAMKNFNDFLK
ncbi:MAG: hypothetical protein LPK26_17920 [Bacillaceae bacterium]|nr:hypothetical protein [Bacillaceae bacterium]